MSLLDLIGLNRIFKSGVAVNPTRKILNFIGEGVTIVDNPGQDRTDITIEGGGGGEGTITGPGTTVDGHLATWVGTDGTELADSGLALADVATEAYVDAAIDALPVGGDVVGPASSADNEIARYDGTDGKHVQRSTPKIADDGRITTVTDPTGAQDADTKAAREAAITTAVAAITSSTAQYKGGSYTPNELRYVSGAWTGVISCVFSGTWTDEIQNGITRSGENFTVTKAGLYSIALYAPSFASGAPPLRGLRVLVNGVQSNMNQLDYGGAASGTSSDAALTGFLSLGVGDVVSFQYINVTGATIFGAFTSGQMGGANVKSARLEMALVAGVRGPQGLPGAGGWQTYCDFNFTQLPNQTIVQGVNSIDGVPMRADNVSLATTFAIVNGTGLFVKNTVANSTFFYTVRNSPMLFCDLPADIPGWLLDQSEVRISCEWNTTVATANYSCSGFGIAKQPFVANQELTAQFWHQYSGGMRRATARLYNSTESSPAVSSTYNTGLIHFKSQYEHEWWAKVNAAANIVANSVVLDPTTMTHLGTVREAPGAGVNASPYIANRDHFIAMWAAHSDNTLGNAEHVCKRLRIEYKL